jgi:formiminotetrahydrofolate cyclodeaminase
MSDPYIASTLIAPYLAQLASPAPTPGGGSASAAVGAIGAALIEMVINVSLRSAHPEHIDELHTELQIATEARARFVVFGTMDERAYNGYRVALALPRSSDEEKSLRRDALEKATIASAEAPMQTALLAESLLKRIVDVASIASSHMRSDLGVAAHLLAAAGSAAIVMVDTNLVLIKTKETADDLLSKRNAIEAGLSSSLKIVLSATA